MTCHDCKKEIVPGEEYMPYNGNFVKCASCFGKDQMLRNFQEAEVYSRVVGYIRPVKAWNAGKRTEFKDRKMFK